jgi:hypothetical protein
MDDFVHFERHLAVTTNWAFFGSFGLVFSISGFAGAQLWTGLFGFALILGGFGAHIVLNHWFGTGFMKGEVALGFLAFVIAVLSFVWSWLAAPSFPATNVAIGLGGFAALLAGFIAYMVYWHGVRGSIAMFDRIRLNDAVFAREALTESVRSGQRRRARLSGAAPQEARS